MTKITIPHEDWLEEYTKVLDSRKRKLDLFGEEPKVKDEDDIFGEDTPEDNLPEVIEDEAPEDEFVGVHPNHLSQMRSIYGRRSYISRSSFTGQLAEVGE